jgi:CubicO group peptidase (beta-lactamase class C family)
MARDGALDADHWQRRLDALAAEHGIPGAVLGIMRLHRDGEDELVQEAYGVLNNRTGVEVTTDSIFQIGSITKVWTATMVMRLVEEGRLDLDAPVVDVLPELKLADPEVSRQLTLRHLLTHSSGIDGDIFTDTGRGDDCLERYVALLEKAAQHQPLGATWSYCNSGFVLIGRVIEKVTGKTWDQALHDYVCTPLGVESVCTLPEEAILQRAAVGHMDPVDGAAPRPTTLWQLPRSTGPAGGIITTAAALLTFARMHMTGGLAADGSRVLSAESTAAMAARQVDLPDKRHRGDSWGLGWTRFSWDGKRLIGHGGKTMGQTAELYLLPEQGLAVVILTNADTGTPLFADLSREIFTEVAGLQPPQPLEPADPAVEVDFAPHLGRYEREGYTFDVFELEGKPWMRMTLWGALVEHLDKTVYEYELRPWDDSGSRFVVYDEDAKKWSPVAFYALPAGERYMLFALRATPKVA